MNQDRLFPTSNFVYEEEEEDDEDISDSLSPSDGYFSQSSAVPATILMIDESLEEVEETEEGSSTSQSKSEEAAQEASSPQRYRPVTPPPPQSPELTRDNVIYTPSTSSRDSAEHSPTEQSSNDETSSLLQDPPPQYEAATAGRPIPRISQPTETAPLSPSNSPTYNTMANVSFPVPFRDVPDHPVSMADNGGGDMYDAEEASNRQNRRRCFNGSTYGGRFRTFLARMISALIIIWLIWFVVIKLTQKPTQPSGKDNNPVDPPAIAPPRPPAVPDTPSLPPTSSTNVPETTTTSKLEPTSSPKPSHPTEPSDPEPVKTLRGISIIHSSESVTGQLPLQDYLYISTTSGAISIEIIMPYDWNSGANADIPCHIDISTISGSINVKFLGHIGHPIGSGFFTDPEPTSSPEELALPNWDDVNGHNPVRPLNSFYSSRGSGSITGTFIHGNSTSFSTKSGSISNSIYPVDSSNPSHLTTRSTSGSQSLHIQSPIAPPKPPEALGEDSSHEVSRNYFTGLTAKHITHGSGSMRLSYPHDWVGEVDLQSHGSGHMTADGQGLEIFEVNGKHVKGRRGHGDEDAGGSIDIDAYGSGSVSFSC